MYGVEGLSIAALPENRDKLFRDDISDWFTMT
jgi:hypothetical protein